MSDDAELKRLTQSLRESASTFRKYDTHTLPAMQSFITRHIAEIENAVRVLTALRGDGTGR